ncbi:MAG: crotonobetainyl-CoA:carnitine CoA-transferase CaiB-like acyl-CoA transferase, partial [Gammaproteobacteria bacterium]
LLVCEILGCEHLVKDERFLTKPERVANNLALVAELEPFFKAQTTAHWCEQFERAGVPAGPVLNHVEALSDPQTKARDMVVEVDHATVGKSKTLGVHVKLSDTPGSVRRAAPTLGQHNDEVWDDWLRDPAQAAD